MEVETVSLCKHWEVPTIIRKGAVVKEDNSQGGLHVGLRRVHMQSRIMKAKYIVTLVMQNCLLNWENSSQDNWHSKQYI